MDTTALGLLLGLLHAVLRLLLLLHGSIQQLFGILLAHLRLGLLLLLLLLLLVLILLLIFLVVFLLIILVLLVLILLILVLLLLLTLAENEGITRLVIIRTQAQGILVGLDGLTIHLVRLTDDTQIMERLVLAHRIGLQLGSALKLYHCRRVLVLRQKRIAKVVDSLRIARILLDSLPI